MIHTIPCTVRASYKTIEEIPTNVLGKRPNFRFSICQSIKDLEDFGGSSAEKECLQIPNLKSKKAVFEGTIQLWSDYWRVSPSEDKIVSKPLKNPTWKEVLEAVDQISENAESDVFLEGFVVNIENNKGIKEVEILFGS